jgi:steroid 5-alpha reductase family enzyme
MILDTLINSVVVIVISMFMLWVLSVLKKNASIVDIFWGLGFVIVGWASAINAEQVSVLGKVVLVLVTLWGLRLSIYLGIRNHGKPEDFRYVAMRKHYGAKFPLISLFTARRNHDDCLSARTDCIVGRRHVAISSELPGAYGLCNWGFLRNSW